MTTYKPAEHEETTSVAPLLQFFELVHIGDTIQSMVQVYFDKELVRLSVPAGYRSPPMLILVFNCRLRISTVQIS
jgi:hypothetical protein